eukprot:TRINITY_DN6709_c0_g1_i1.p1 TRINITY_DN6709_c0_g1~~TRINITY_DN6709_c0_g1_i1.p1  ORF type:complete len:145 (+),score=50.69 TRINITY_DN6709_c0_g1_i1:57-437(+)
MWRSLVSVSRGLFQRRAASTAFYGPRQKHIEATLTAALQPSHLEVTNESHGRVEDESHFHVCVVSEKFENASRVAVHRMVQGPLMEGSALPFHSLRITARTPAQWETDSSVPDAPKCKGGDGVRKN